MAEVFLYVLLYWPGDYRRQHRYVMPDMTTCEKILKASKMSESTGNDNEWAMLMFCAGSHAEYDVANGEWVSVL